MGQSEAKAESKFRFRQPTVEVMPAQPARDRLRAGIDKKDALPRDEHIVEPHLAVELVVTAAERRDEMVGSRAGELAAQCRDAGRIDRDDKASAVLADLDAAQAPT